MARLRRKHDSRNLDDHIVAKTNFVEFGAQEAPVANINWDVEQAEVHSDPVMDPGRGPKAIIRRFQFKLPPIKDQASKEEIFEYHKKNTVIPLLWKDELDLLDEPRIVMGKKGAFTIVAICAPAVKLGVKSTIHERPELVHNIINDSSKNTDKLH